jgi:hemolysin activation/secretion protein
MIMIVMTKISLPLASIAVIPFMVMTAAVPAHAAPLVPSTAEPAALQREQTDSAKPNVSARTIPPTFPENVNQLPQYQAKEGFLLRSVVLKGAHKFPPAFFESYWKNLIGKKVTVAVMQQIINRINATYRDAGFVLSFAAIGSQTISEGEVVIHITEQGLADVKIETDNPALQNSALFQQAKKDLLNSQPLEAKVLDKVLLILNDLPGVSVTSLLTRQQHAPYGFEMVLRVNQKQHSTTINLNNRGSHYVGPWIPSVQHAYRGLLNPFDEITASGSTSTDNQELRVVSLGYQRPLGSQGTTLKTTVGRNWSEPGYTLTPSRIESISSNLSVTLTHPLQRSFASSLSLEGSFNMDDYKTKSLGVLVSKDKTRSVDAQLRYDIADRWGGVSLLQGKIAQGLSVLGATDNDNPFASRINGREDFSKVSFYGEHQHPLWGKFSLYTAATGQYAFTQLLSNEEASYGGTQFGRGYDPSEITGDHGISTLVEIRKAHETKTSHISNVQSFASYDFGSSWRIDTENREPKLTGASIAGGIRFRLFDTLQTELSVAKPLTRSISSISQEDAKDPRAFLSLKLGL